MKESSDKREVKAMKGFWNFVSATSEEAGLSRREKKKMSSFIFDSTEHYLASITLKRIHKKSAKNKKNLGGKVNV